VVSWNASGLLICFYNLEIGVTRFRWEGRRRDRLAEADTRDEIPSHTA
jgi:hypothetical protein